MSGEVVPFGKYKDQPAETLLADPDYCQWLLAQPWFRGRWPNVYNVVINYGAEPQDSPEHNQMQAGFLDDNLCFRLADLLNPDHAGHYSPEYAERRLASRRDLARLESAWEIWRQPGVIRERQFEDRGWDVTFKVHPGRAEARSTVDPIPLADTRLLTSLSESGTCRYPDCYPRSVLVELKPDLGDDYPAVLRQVLQYPLVGSYALRCVVARRHQFEQVTWDQVRHMFAASKIRLLAESEIDAA